MRTERTVRTHKFSFFFFFSFPLISSYDRQLNLCWAHRWKKIKNNEFQYILLIFDAKIKIQTEKCVHFASMRCVCRVPVWTQHNCVRYTCSGSNVLKVSLSPVFFFVVVVRTRLRWGRCRCRRQRFFFRCLTCAHSPFCSTDGKRAAYTFYAVLLRNKKIFVRR